MTPQYTISDTSIEYGLAVHRQRQATVELSIPEIEGRRGELMAVDVTDKTEKNYQTARLKEKAAPKTINEEVGFLLRLLGEAGDTGTGRQGVHL